MASPFADLGFAPTDRQAPAAAAASPFAGTGFAPVPVAAAVPPMSEPIGVTEFGAPIFADDKDNAKVREGMTRAVEKGAEGATLGLAPFGEAAVNSVVTGKPYGESLKAARDYSAETSRDYPAASMIAEGVGSVAPTLATGAGIAPLAAAARGAFGRIGPWLAGTAGGAALGGASAAGHDIGSGQTDNIGKDTAVGAGVGGALSAVAPVVGAALQAGPNMVAGAYQGIRNIATGQGRDAIAGQILRETSGDFANSAARSPVPGLQLRTAQETGNPGLAALDRTLASTPGGTANNPGSLVQNGRTSDQTDALARALAGSDARIEPAVLANQAGAKGTQAVTGADNALREVERGLWSHPALQSVGTTAPGLNGPAIAGNVANDVAGFPASLRDAVTGPQNKLGGFVRELNEVGPNATIADVNSIRSRLLGVARDARSGANPDSVTAAAASRMADSLLGHVGNDPAVSGAAPGVNFHLTQQMPVTHVDVADPVTIRAMGERPATTVSGGDAGVPMTQPGPSATQYAITTPLRPNPVPVPVTIRASGSAGVPGNPDAWGAYQAARDFTRNYNTATGFNEFDNILHPNVSGNIQANPEQAFGRFFDFNGGTSTGLQRLQGVSDLLRTSGRNAEADALDASARDYARAALLRQSRAGNGLDASGLPAMNVNTLASTANKVAPALSGVPMTAPIAGEVQAAGNAGELLGRPASLRGDANSTTFEKLKNNDLVSAIIGQSGSSALGAAAGGYEAARNNPTDVPAYLAVPGGMLAGALMGRQLGPYMGKAIANFGAKGLVAGPTEDVLRRTAAGLADPAEYRRLLAAQLLNGPGLFDPGAVSAATGSAVRAAIPQASAGGAR